MHLKLFLLYLFLFQNPVLSVDKRNAVYLTYITYIGSALSVFFTAISLIIYTCLQWVLCLTLTEHLDNDNNLPLVLFVKELKQYMLGKCVFLDFLYRTTLFSSSHRAEMFRWSSIIISYKVLVGCILHCYSSAKKDVHLCRPRCLQTSFF